MLKKILKYKVILSIFLLLIIVGIILVFIKFKPEKFKVNENSIIDVNDEYYIKVEYPIVDNDELNDEMKKTVDKEIENFKEAVDKSKKNIDYELNIRYELSKTDRLTTIHIVVYKYLSKEYYERNDYIYYYDYVDDKVLTIDDIFINYSDSLKKIAELADYELRQNYAKEIYDDSQYNLGVISSYENYQLIKFEETGLAIIFKPNQVSRSEIKIELKYDDVNELLNDEYRGPLHEPAVEEEIDGTRNVRNLENLKDKKLIAITFDDGPSSTTTKKLLDELKKRDAKVTFFVLGNRIKNREELIQEAYLDGHTIGSHTYSHKNLNNLSIKGAKREIDKTNKAIEGVIGTKPFVMRPPYGNFNNELLKNSNMTFILWNVDTEDWKYRDSDHVYEHIMNHAQDGNIILLHDIYETSVDGALRAIDELLKQDYAIVSVEELEQLGRINLEKGTYYYNFR